ncbi:unnamed protein product [Caenorhabditis auriculariae]|uniref:CX domain-containing protein n=1 Tax=Caenorhabditis auriculariae TaxID=2777116 RepID=A0A8S1HGA9_9PELO|nr:unnamed protein product [Caenorhabditis auriculariae]
MFVEREFQPSPERRRPEQAMSRWDALPNSRNSNPTLFPQNAAVGPSAEMTSLSQTAQLQQMGQVAGTGPDEVNQHGTIGRFLRMELEGGFSSFVRCIYEAKRTNNNTVTLVCERDQECCEHGCCPKDQHWMAGVYVLLAFVLLVFVVGTVLMICCYQRSKNKQRKEEREAAEYHGYAASQVGGPGAYSSYGTLKSKPDEQEDPQKNFLKKWSARNRRATSVYATLARLAALRLVAVYDPLNVLLLQ